ncbi:MAG: hypothetical protein ACLFPL_01320 [Candidatus Nanoarchaeia archaeon]
MIENLGLKVNDDCQVNPNESEAGDILIASTESKRIGQLLGSLTRLRNSSYHSGEPRPYIGLSTEESGVDMFAHYLLLASPFHKGSTIPPFFFRDNVSTIPETSRAIEGSPNMWYPFRYFQDTRQQELQLQELSANTKKNGKKAVYLDDLITLEQISRLSEDLEGFFNPFHGKVIFSLGGERGLNYEQANELVERVGNLGYLEFNARLFEDS